MDGMEHIIVGIRRQQNLRPPKSVTVLSSEWPRTYQACVETYFDHLTFGVVDQAKHCPAGYMLAAVTRFEEVGRKQFAHRELTRADFDVAAACEINFQWKRKRLFRDTKAALFKCLMNLLSERPERICSAYVKGGGR